MYRSRPAVLVILAATAACSTRNSKSEAVAGLAHDSTLARIGVAPREAQPLPDACGTVTVSTKPVAANESLAKDLSRQAYDAELVGHVMEARSLLSRAARLDGTDQSLAYHLGRTSEALGDRAAAITAYCHYLTLASGAPGAADARQRVARLALTPASVATNVSPPARVAPPARVVHPRAAVVVRRVASSSSGIRLGNIPAGESVAVAAPDDPPATDAGVRRSSSDGDVVATSSGAPVATAPSPASRTPRRGPTRAEGAGIGAVAGAIIGAVTGHSVKSAVIGAAAGGILGTVVAGPSR